jgi:hypothetical protein
VAQAFGLWVKLSDIHTQDLKWCVACRRSSVCGSACGPHQPVLAKTTPRARLLGVSQLGASFTMVSHSPRCSCCRVSTARRDTRRRMLQTQSAAAACVSAGLCGGVHDFLAPALYLFGVAAAAGLVAGGAALLLLGVHQSAVLPIGEEVPVARVAQVGRAPRALLAREALHATYLRTLVSAESTLCARPQRCSSARRKRLGCAGAIMLLNSLSYSAPIVRTRLGRVVGPRGQRVQRPTSHKSRLRRASLSRGDAVFRGVLRVRHVLTCHLFVCA